MEKGKKKTTQFRWTKESIKCLYVQKPQNLLICYSPHLTSRRIIATFKMETRRKPRLSFQKRKTRIFSFLRSEGQPHTGLIAVQNQPIGARNPFPLQGSRLSSLGKFYALFFSVMWVGSGGDTRPTRCSALAGIVLIVRIYRHCIVLFGGLSRMGSSSSNEPIQRSKDF